MNASGILLSVVFCFFSAQTMAAVTPPPLQGRLFAGGVAISPKDVNEELLANHLKKMSASLLIGGEITYPVLSRLDLGFRYMKNQVSQDEDPSDFSHSYEAAISQDIAQVVARIPVLKSSFARFDAFAAYGGASTNLKLKTSTQNGEIGRKELFETPVSSGGVSASIGYKTFFVFVEAGVMDNKIQGFKRTGTVNNNIEIMDLSGSYFTVGIQFNGEKITGGSSSSGKK